MLCHSTMCHIRCHSYLIWPFTSQPAGVSWSNAGGPACALGRFHALCRLSFCRALPGVLSGLLSGGAAGAQVLEARVDHARVVGILRKADHLPLIKDYLLAVQKANLAAVNEAVNELLVEEDDFCGLRESITTYDNYDQVTAASPLHASWHNALSSSDNLSICSHRR